jgi:hypothetical protein
LRANPNPFQREAVCIDAGRFADNANAGVAISNLHAYDVGWPLGARPRAIPVERNVSGIGGEVLVVI